MLSKFEIHRIKNDFKSDCAVQQKFNYSVQIALQIFESNLFTINVFIFQKL